MYPEDKNLPTPNPDPEEEVASTFAFNPTDSNPDAGQTPYAPPPADESASVSDLEEKTGKQPTPLVPSTDIPKAPDSAIMALNAEFDRREDDLAGKNEVDETAATDQGEAEVMVNEPDTLLLTPELALEKRELSAQELQTASDDVAKRLERLQAKTDKESAPTSPMAVDFSEMPTPSPTPDDLFTEQSTQPLSADEIKAATTTIEPIYTPPPAQPSPMPPPPPADEDKTTVLPKTDAPVVSGRYRILTPMEIERAFMQWFKNLPDWVESVMRLLAATTALTVIGSLASILPDPSSVFDLIPIWLGVNLIYFPMLGLIAAIELTMKGIKARRRASTDSIMPSDETPTMDKTPITKPRPFIGLRHWRLWIAGFVTVAPLTTTIFINLQLATIEVTAEKFFDLMELTTVSYYLVGMVYTAALVSGLLIVLGILWNLYAVVQFIRRRNANHAAPKTPTPETITPPVSAPPVAAVEAEATPPADPSETRTDVFS